MSSSVDDNNAGAAASHEPLAVGQIVTVSPRTWAGVNQPGGVARITALSSDKVSVKYVLDGRQEKDIDNKYVSNYRQTTRLRDRNLLLGRCLNCGSLRNDCGSCDIRSPEQPVPVVPKSNNKHAKRRPEKTTVPLDSLQFLGRSVDAKSSSSDENSTDDTEELLRKIRQRDTLYNRYKAKQQALSTQSARDLFDSDSSSDSEDEFRVSQLAMQSVELQGSEDRRSSAFRWSLSTSVDRQKRRRGQSHRRGRQRLRNNSCLTQGENGSSRDINGQGSVRNLSHGDARNGNSDDSSGGGRSRAESDTHMSVSSQGSVDSENGSLDSRSMNQNQVVDEQSSYGDFRSDEDDAQEDDYWLADSQLDNFIQPEGEAAHLPVDIVDRTKGLDQTQLLAFFDETAGNLEKNELPQAKRQVLSLERQFRDLDKQSKQDIHADPKELLLRARKVFFSCQAQESSLIRTLFHVGVDQCQAALGKLVAEELIREFKMNSLFDACEDIMSRMRRIMNQVKAVVDDLQGALDYSDDEGWIDPYDDDSRSDASTQGPFQAKSLLENDAKDEGLHPYAAKRRTGRPGVNTKKRRTDIAEDATKLKLKSNRKRGQSVQVMRSFASTGVAKQSTKRRRADHLYRTADDGNDSSNDDPNDMTLLELAAANKGTNPHCGQARSNARSDKSAASLSTKERRSRVQSHGQEFPWSSRNVKWKGLARRAPATGSCDGLPGESDAQGLSSGARAHRQLKHCRHSSTSSHSPVNRPKSRTKKSAVDDNARSSPQELQQELIVSLQNCAVAESECIFTPQEPFVGSTGDKSISDLGHQLNEKYRIGTCIGVLGSISASTDPSNLPLVLNMLVDLLVKNGCETILSLVSREIRLFRNHICVLCTILRLTRTFDTELLLPSHGTVYNLFGSGNHFVFSGAVIFQVVDCVCALLNPGAWSLSIKNPREIICELSFLRFELSQRNNLTERVCKCLLEEQPVQEWCLSNDGTHCFVTCVNPGTWRQYLSTGDLPVSTHATSTRISALGDGGWPSSERDMLWSLLAYFMKERVSSTDPVRNIWLLLSKLMFKGALFKDTSNENSALPPCSEQLDRMTRDLQVFATFLRTGAFANLPISDKLLVAVIKECLLLQAEIITTMSSQLLIGSASEDRRRQRALWIQILKPNDELPELTHIVTQTYVVANVGASNNASDANILLPCSMTSRSCLELLSAYILLVPAGKNPRKKRLQTCLKVMAADLVSAAKTRPDLDLFAAAFQLHDLGLGQDEQAVFLVESVVHINILLAFSGEMRSCGLRELCDNIWDLCSDKSMKQFRLEREVIVNATIKNSSLNMAPMRVCSTAKTITFLCSLLLGLNPWTSGSAPLSSSYTGFVEEAMSNDPKVVQLLFSYLVSCFECACECTGSLTAVTTTAVYLGMLYSRCRQLLLDRQHVATHPIIQQIRQCLVCIVSDSISAFQRCFALVQSDQFNELECSAALESILRMLESALLLNLVDYNGPLTNPVSSTPQHQDEDVLFGLSDEALATMAMDIDCVVSESTGCGDVWDTLKGALDLAKPSTRFVWGGLECSKENVLLTMRLNGKVAVSRNIRSICGCLVLLALRAGVSYIERLVSVITAATRLEEDLLDDASYRQEISRFLIGALCHFGKGSNLLDRFFSQNTRLVVLHILQEQCDTWAIRRLPSCNVVRLKAVGGIEFEKQAFTELVGRSHAKKRVRQLWEDLKAFGNLLEQSNGAGQSTWSQLVWDHIDTTDFDIQCHPCSVEAVCLKRIMIIGNIVRVASLSSIAMSLTPFLVAWTASNLLRFEKTLLIDPQESNGEYSKTFEEAHMMEVIGCSVEAMVATLCHCFCRECGGSSDSLGLYTLIRNRFLVPLMRGDAMDCIATLRKIISACQRVARGDAVNSEAYARLDSAGKATHQLNEMFQQSISRHARVFVFQLARDFSSEETRTDHELLVHAFLSSKAYASVGQAFACGRVTPSNNKGPACLSPLHTSVVQYLFAQETKVPPSRFSFQCLIKLKQYAISNYLSSMLEKDIVSDSKKVDTLRMLRRMLETESDDPLHPIDDEPRLPLQVLCKLARGLRKSMQKALAASMVEEIVVEGVYECAKALFVLPSASVDPYSVGWFIDWCDPANYMSTPTECVSIHCQRRFLWSVLTWLKHLGTAVMETETGAFCLTAERHRLREPSLSNDSSAEGAGNDCYLSMMELEKDVFPSSDVSVIRNVYASTNRRNNEPLQNWEPSNQVKTAVNRLVSLTP